MNPIPAHLGSLRALAEDAMVDTAAVYRPDYAGDDDPTLIATTRCRVTRYPTNGGDVLDLSGDATNLIHLPEGTDAGPGDEILVNGTRRYLALPTNDGRTYAFDLQVAAKRES